MVKHFEPINPTDFESPDQVPPRKKSRIKPFQIVLGACILLALSVLYFVLNAKAVQIETNAELAMVEITGGINFPIGESQLLLSGNYNVEISADGFEVLSEPLRVSRDTPTQLFYELSPLPGNLSVSLLADDDLTATGVLSGTNLETDIQVQSGSPLLFENVPAGNYQLQIDANLYAETTIDVEHPGRSLTQVMNVELEPNWGWVHFESNPGHANLYANGEIVLSELTSSQPESGKFSTRLEAGAYELRVSLENYKPVIREIVLNNEDEYDFGDLLLEHVDSLVRISTSPSNATVLVNDVYAGESPMTLDLLPDVTHQIKLLKPGYKPVSDTLTVQRNSDQELSYELNPDLIQVSLSLYPQNAELRISGEPVASNANRISLTAISHQIEVSAPGYKTQSMEFLPIRGTRQHLQVRLLTEEEALWAQIPPRYSTIAKQEMKLFRDPGKVTMGSSRRETDRRANEAIWSATLKRPFYVSVKEVTNQQYKIFDPEHSSGHFEGYSLDSANQPVTGISWQQAALYCNWLSEKENLEPFYTIERGFVSGVNAAATGYRLVTEAEWVWLAKMSPSGFPKKYIWGDVDEVPGPIENFADLSVSSHINFTLENITDNFVTTAPVGSFEANEKGLFDLAGNVNEWIHDWYAPAPYSATDRVEDPLGPEEGEFHVIRGASWARGYLPQLRLAYRDYDSTGRNDLGFRVARYAM